MQSHCVFTYLIIYVDTLLPFNFNLLIVDEVYIDLRFFSVVAQTNKLLNTRT